MAVGFETLGMGAGAAKSLEDLLAQRRADELMQERGMETLVNMQNTRAWREQQAQDREEAIQQRREAAQERADVMKEAHRVRGEADAERAIGLMMPGDVVPSSRYQQLEQAGGAAFPVTRFQPIQSSDFQGPVQEGEAPLGSEGGMRFLGTQPQLQKIDEANNKQSDAEERLRLLGLANDTRNQAALAHIEAERARAEAAAQHASDVASRPTSPTQVLRINGVDHIGYVKQNPDGSAQWVEAPLPSGAQVVRPAPTGPLDRLMQWWNGGDAAPANPAITPPQNAGDPTNKNWGRR